MSKILIDVTQSSRSSNNSGIQVVTRNLFREVESLHETIPVIWDNILCKYRFLSASEFQYLRNPFYKKYTAKSRPNKQENPFLKEIIKSLFSFNKIINFEHYVQKKSLFIFPEVFRDKRVFHINKLINVKLKKVGIFHDANVLRNPNTTPLARTKNFNNYLDIISSFRALSCVSKESKQSLEKIFFDKKSQSQIEVHHLPVEKPSRHVPSSERRIPLILCVSTLAYNKNHLTLLQSAERLWKSGLDFELELIGQYDPSWSHKVLESVNHLIAKKRPVKWLKHVDQETLEEKYSDCSFTVYPSLYEGYGLPILESLSRSKPCICGSNGAIGEVSKGGGCMNLLNQESVEELSSAIQELLLNPGKLKQLKLEADGRNYGTWKEYSKNIINFFFSTI